MSEENVIAMPGFSVPNDQPVAAVVEILTEALREAMDGQIIGIAVVAVRKQPLSFGTSYHGEHSSRHTLAAGAMSMAFSIARELTDSVE